MKGFFEQLKWKMAGSMQNRRGADALSNTLVVAGIVFMLLSFFTGIGLFSWLSLVVLIYAIFRTYSRNISARDRENEAFLRITEKPRRAARLANKKWANRQTTRYFRCKGCGQELSVPRGKGTLRVVCPKCKTETTMKS